MCCGAKGHELQRETMVNSVSFSLLCLNFCLLLPAEFMADMWITENTSSGLTECSPWTDTAAHKHTVIHTHTEVLHQLPLRNASSNGERKFDAPIMIPSWNFELPLHPPFCISVLRCRSLFLIAVAPSHHQHFCHHPFLSFSLQTTHSYLPYRRLGWPLQAPLQLPKLHSLICLSFTLSRGFFQ